MKYLAVRRGCRHCRLGAKSPKFGASKLDITSVGFRKTSASLNAWSSIFSLYCSELTFSKTSVSTIGQSVVVLALSENAAQDAQTERIFATLNTIFSFRKRTLLSEPLGTLCNLGLILR